MPPIHNVMPLVCLCRDQRLQEVWLLHGTIVTQGGRMRGNLIGQTLFKVRDSLQFILWRSRSGCITIVLGLPHVHLVADCGALWSLWRVGWPSRGSRKTNLHCILTVDRHINYNHRHNGHHTIPFVVNAELWLLNSSKPFTSSVS